MNILSGGFCEIDDKYIAWPRPFLKGKNTERPRELLKSRATFEKNNPPLFSGIDGVRDLAEFGGL